MSGQGQTAPPAVEAAVLDAAVQVLTARGSSGLTLAHLAEAAGTSRMTLHRRGVTIPGVLAALSLRAALELREALYPALTSTAPARDRLVQALEATFDVADRNLPVLAGLFADDAAVFHGQAGPDGALPTEDVFVAPFAKLLADGAGDGSLRGVDDVVETATVLFNTAGWGYVQLRHAQRWPVARARSGVTALVLDGLAVQA